MFLISPAVEENRIAGNLALLVPAALFDFDASARFTGEYVMGTDIPGLIEPVEFEALEKVSGAVVPGSSIIEFGCYLGKSTSAILKGANLVEDTKIFVFDGFKIKETDPFARTMLGHVNSLGLTELVYRDKKGFTLE